MMGPLLALSVMVASGCDVVFQLERPPADGNVPVDDADVGVDAAPACTRPDPNFGLPLGLIGVFSPVQTVVGPITARFPSYEVMVYGVDDGAVGTHAYNVIPAYARRPLGGAWTHAGYVQFAPILGARAEWPRLWSNDEDLVFMFFETPGQRHLATPTNAYEGMWSHTPFTQSVAGLELPTDHIAGVARGGTRLIVAREADHTIVEIERNAATGALGAIVPSTGMINATGGGDHPSITADGCWLLFDRPDTAGHELWIARRGNDDMFEMPRKLLGSSTPEDETWPSLSEDGTTLYYSSWLPTMTPVNYEKMVYRMRE